jgi:hypothetical protein
MNIEQINAIERRYQGTPLGFKFCETEAGATALHQMFEFHPNGQAIFLHLASYDTSKPIPILVDWSFWKNPVFQQRIAPHVERITSVRQSVLRQVQYGTDDERKEFAAAVINKSLRKNLKPRCGPCEYELTTDTFEECGFYGVTITARDTRNAPHEVAFQLILDGWSAYSFAGSYADCIRPIDTYDDIKKALVELLGNQTKLHK